MRIASYVFALNILQFSHSTVEYTMYTVFFNRKFSKNSAVRDFENNVFENEAETCS